MNRNSQQTYSGTYYQGGNTHYKSVSSALGGTLPQRTPLYPIGPTLPQPQFKVIQRGTSPYLSRQGLMPPSYEQRNRHQTSTGFAQGGDCLMEATKLNYQERERDLIGRNQNEIEEEHKRRQQIRMSYQRQIATKTACLSRTSQRKQRLLAELDILERTKQDLHSHLMDLRPPDNKINTFQPIDRKQQEMMIMKNKLIGQMREKEAQLYKEQEEEEKFWENQLVQKEKILLKLQLQSNSKRIALNGEKNSLEKPDIISLEDEVREQRYQDYIFQVSQVEGRINRLTQERESLSQEVREGLIQKNLQTHNLKLRREDLVRQRQQMLLRVSQLERIGREMQEANSNLFNEYDRKQNMIVKYENDIQELKEKKKLQEAMMNEEFRRAREVDQELISGLAREIGTVQEDLRLEQSATTRLKTQYQRLYELLCSSTIKNLHQSFGALNSQEIVS